MSGNKAPNDPVKEQDKYGKSFEDCDSKERQSVGGTKGGQKRVEQIGPEGMAEMGSHGGQK